MGMDKITRKEYRKEKGGFRASMGELQNLIASKKSTRLKKIRDRMSYVVRGKLGLWVMEVLWKRKL